MTDLEWNREFALEQAGDDEEILAELLDLFRETSATDLSKIKDGVNSGNPEAAGDAAHSIKGAAASLGFEAIRQLAYDIETAGRNSDLNAIAEKIAELEMLIAQLDQAK